MSEITIVKGFGRSPVALTLSGVPFSVVEEATETLEIGTPNLRTTWVVNSIQIQAEMKTAVREAAAEIKRKAIILLEVVAFFDNVPTVLTILKQEFKENVEEHETGEIVNILESITPFTIPPGHNFSLALRLKRGRPNFLGIKTHYEWALINPTVTAFIQQSYAATSLSRSYSY